MRKIVFSANTSWFIYNFYLGLIREFQAHGWEVHVIAPHDHSTELLTANGVFYYNILMSNAGASVITDFITLCKYISLYKKIKPKWAFHFTIKPNMYGTLAAALFRIKIINTVTGLGTAFISQTIVSKIVGALYRISQPLATQIFVLNSDDYQLLATKKLCNPDKMTHIPGSGFDISRFVPVGQEQNPNFTFLYFGRILWDKGIGEFVEAMRLLRSKGYSCRLELVGYIGVANKTAISLEQVHQWEAEGLLVYSGSTTDVRPAIANSNCIVLPSYREGLPQSLMEASAMAKPIIATDVPGCRDVVVDGVTGLLCFVKNAHSLAVAMEHMINLPEEKRANMGRAGRAHIEAHFTTDIVYEYYKKLVVI